MKLRDLIEQLRKLPGDSDVMVSVEKSFGDCDSKSAKVVYLGEAEEIEFVDTKKQFVHSQPTGFKHHRHHDQKLVWINSRVKKPC